MKVDDLSELEILDENSIVQTLRCRFNKNQYYVSIYDVIEPQIPTTNLQSEYYCKGHIAYMLYRYKCFFLNSNDLT